jgi:hypothetical protein
MTIIKAIAVAALFISTSAQANCGNDKNVGNGCINTTPIAAAPINVTSVVASGDTRNDNRNSNNNSAVANGGSVRNSVNNTNVNSAKGGAGGNSTASVSGNTVQSNSEINVQNNTTSIAPRSPVASAIAPNTIFSGGLDSCMGTSSGSMQGLSFGVAVGTTWTDNHCVALRAAVRLNELGFKGTAAARLCAIPEIKEAFAKSKEFDCGE